jgi:plasmid stabilization system protein ParE
MPQVKLTDRANQDLQRFAQFLQEVAPEKIDEALDTIFDRLEILENNPLSGEPTPCEAIQDLRKLTIPYGKNGYVALYRYDQKADIVLVETLRHMLELEPDFLRPF